MKVRGLIRNTLFSLYKPMSHQIFELNQIAIYHTHKSVRLEVWQSLGTFCFPEFIVSTGVVSKGYDLNVILIH